MWVGNLDKEHDVIAVPPESVSGSEVALSVHYERIRNYTELLAAPLSPEDQTVQSMPDVSPTKWHRAHVTWFFETFVHKLVVHHHLLMDELGNWNLEVEDNVDYFLVIL